MPDVSVIIPTYNRAHLISRAIQSVLDQSYQDFEIIVVDDCSTDNTEEVIREFQEKDERIRYIRHERNKGPAAARNSGIKAVKGEYIAFQDSDDEWLPEKLEKQMKVFKISPPEVGVVYTGFWRLEKTKKTYIPFSWVTQKEGNIHEDLLRGNFIGTPVALIRKECFKKVELFDEYISAREDWELWIRISKYYEFKYIPEPLMISYYTSGGVDEKSIIVNINILEFIVNKHYKNFAEHKKILSKHYFNIGLNLCSIRHLSKGKKYFIKAIKIYPLDIRYSLMLIISVFGQKALSTVVEAYRKFKNIIYKGKDIL